MDHNESYICINDNIVFYRKGLGVWRGKIIDFYNYRGLRVKCQFGDYILTFSAKNLVKTSTFWWVGLDSLK